MMDTLARIARRRAVMTTVADLIVAAAAGKTLRVAVGCTHPDETGFADKLTQALHARGRPCRCLPCNPGPVADDGSTPAGRPTMAVITSGSPAADDTDLCRIDIEVHTPVPVSDPPDSAQPKADGQSRSTRARHAPDIVIDDLSPDGPTIRHIQPSLTSPSDQQ
jgi:hypothetical protein